MHVYVCGYVHVFNDRDCRNPTELCSELLHHHDSMDIRTFNRFHWVNMFVTDKKTLKLIVRADLRKGYSPVTGAKVEVQVGSSPWKPMKDNGLGKSTISGHLLHTYVRI